MEVSKNISRNLLYKAFCQLVILFSHLNALQHVFPDGEQEGVSGRPVQVHHRLDELRPQRVPLALVGSAPLRHVVELGQEAVLLPYLNEDGLYLD